MSDISIPAGAPGSSCGRMRAETDEMCGNTHTCSQRVVKSPSCEALRTEAGWEEVARIAAVRAEERVVVVDL